MVAFNSGLGTLYGYYAGMVQTDPVTGQVTRQEDSFVTMGNTFKTLFWGIFSMTSLEAPNVIIESGGGASSNSDSIDDSEMHHGFTQFVGYGLFAAFEVFMVIVMLNMLIASLSNTFQRVVDNAEDEWLFGRTKVYVNYMLLDDLPPPFNLFRLAMSPLTDRRRRHVSSGYDALMERGSEDKGDHYDDDSSDYDDDPIECRALTHKLIQRYFTHKSQQDKSSDN